LQILVYAHDLSIGGSQINAIDLAAGVAATGHQVFVYGILGPLVEYIHQRGLPYIEARRLRYRPAPSRILQLAALARTHRLDLIHAYEWPPCLDAYFATGLAMRVPVLCTVLSMAVMPFVPRSLPLIMGTEALAEQARQVQRGEVWVMEPPIDVEWDQPGIDGQPFRNEHNVTRDELLIVSVSRLAVDLKLDALVRVIDAAELLAVRYRVRLVLVGGGPAHAALQCRAAAVNRRRGREVVTLAGPRLDPRQAYAAADVVLGMGSSALRALAIGRPVVVQGEQGFSEICEPDTLPIFLRQGFHGVGDNTVGAERLACQLESLLCDAHRREALGRFGRSLVVERFSLERAVDRQLQIYESVLGHRARRSYREAASSAARALVLELGNHNPRLQHRRRSREAMLLRAAGEGVWPPSQTARYF
jgi:L-malate glycosyltransferase